MLNGFFFVLSTQFLSKCNVSKLVSTLYFLVAGVKDVFYIPGRE